MPRPRSFDEEQVIALGKQLFWEHGYLATSVADIEEATGLSRSSLYGTFGSKRDLFDEALRVYVETFIDPLLGPLESKDAGLREAAGYFKILARIFERPGSQRGCLMINTIGECAGRDADLTRQGQAFLARVRSAFANALKSSVRDGVMTRRQASQRAGLLSGAAVGAWMTVRADPKAARDLCRSAASQVESWSGAGSSR